MIRSDLALAALASAAVPGMRPVSVAAIRTGEENPLHQSALVEDVTGRRWVVRSPLGAAAGAELERNDDLVRQLGKHLPFKVPAAAGYADLGRDGRAAIYPYVEGQALSLRHLPAEPGLPSAVGRAIAAVHNMPRELFEEHAVPVFDAAEFRSRRLAELDRAAETGHVPNGLLARWEHALDAAPMWQFATVPTHGSLDGSCFLVVFSDDDAASGRVVGMSGWERAQVADPAEDFARLVEQSNPRAVDAVFESYALARSQRPDGYLLHRARLASEMRLLNGLAGAVGSDDAAFVRVRADELRKLDRLTANDDSLVPRTALVPSAPPAPESADASDVDAAEPQDVAGTQPHDVAAMPAPEASAGHSQAVVAVADELGDEGTLSGDVDATAPVPTALDRQDDDDEPAVTVERPAEGSHLEPAHPHEAHASDGSDEAHGSDAQPAVSPADVTAPIPMFRPVDAPSRDSDLTSGDVDLPSSDVDLPSPGVAPAAVDGESGKDEFQADERPPSGEGHGENADADDEIADTQIAATEVRDDEIADTSAAPADRVDEPVSTEPAPTAPVDGPSETGLASDDSAERTHDEADERLHTLYGMPDADDADSWESGKR